ncbi:hypothetical protein EDD18DRAFT_1342436 [Armillaria luteobubalina]|uniref:Uncharacterized protein n=1 Tax=Armillaria luteobubalina TaxID=153913 RepID=A0AA39QPI5_9AGAR|nr:hypothetical protein EDD18DRAFT_1342436 [Armillaria luteobubalina]
MSTAPSDILCADQRHVLMGNSSYTAHPQFLSLHEWVHSGSANILADVDAAHSIDQRHSSKAAEIVVVGRVMANPRFIKLKDVGNFNDRFMKIDAAKWVIHLCKPTRTLFEKDWDVSMNNLLALEQRVAVTKGVNMLVYHEEDGNVNLRMTAPCFVSNTIEDDDVALANYMHNVDPRFYPAMKALNPYWKLNALKITNMKGDTVPPGDAQEKSMEGSLVEIAFTMKHYFISTSRTDSFGANISWARIMVSRLRREDAEEAYDSYMEACVTDSNSSQELGKDSLSEDTISSGGAEAAVNMKEEVKEEMEDDIPRKRKGKGGASDRNTKKAKVGA